MKENLEMTQYLLSVHNPTPRVAVPPEQMERMFAQVDAVNTDLQKTGAWVFAGGLEEADTATVVDGATGAMTDGPYLEGKEHIGGFWIIEVDDLDAALDWARRASKACEGPVEVRPFQGM
jgi:hypothetical protein